MQSPSLKIIGLTGKKQSGKDEVCRILHGMVPASHTFQRLAFADGLKIEVAEMLETTVSHINENKHRLEIRKLLQWWGSELRRSEDVQYWIKKIETQINLWPKQPTVIVITDCRYKNEAEWITSQGGVMVRIERRVKDKSGNYLVGDEDSHSSEMEQDSIPCSFTIINDSTLSKLQLETKYVWEFIKERMKIQ